MPYKIGDSPSPKATLAEIADYMEVECLLSKERCFSIVEAAENSGFVEDEDEIDSIGTDAYSEFSDALNQIDFRAYSTSNKYPFVAETKMVSINEGCSEYYRILYSFLLFATRWKMGADRIVNQKDGTLLFERLCKEVLSHYFGPYTKSMVFGTGSESNPNGFENKVKKLLKEFKEKGYQFKYPAGIGHNHKDGGIDLVAFTPFNDERKGHFIAFGQCKTGTSWRDKLGQMNPRSFCDVFLTPPLRFTPISIYMVSEAVDDNWELLASRASGLLLDRTRIVQFLPDEINQDLYEDIKLWVEGVKEMSLQ